ncbi:type III secretion protein T [Trinickia symbiotica]|uniref:EscT/YscT/HrcT family type III secretion system export apparatus protein n=1 Tax=Trinickia symbiotica TaxID=863227 RepID=A0A2N7X8I0_9BURK|nr:flagellar biosynthetic protein FliR [Trinickia symbiotica]PMS37862.1 hypothetical protein C0Z20_03290 [Trinickia symbiotica]PPK47519.1 type III secretion protein T [Trinickia symbiotica]
MITELAAVALPYVLSLGLAAARWVPALILVPAFSPQALSVSTRGAIALALALPVAPSMLPLLQAAPPPSVLLALLAGKELALGFLLAVTLAIPLWAIEAVGVYVDYQRGANPQALDPAASPDASTTALILQRASCVYLMQAGAFHALLGAVYASFGVWPPLELLPSFPDNLWQTVEPLLRALVGFTATLALPYLLALGLIEGSFALLARANPRFPAYVAALPLKSVAALLLVALSLPTALQAVHDVVAGQAGAIDRAARDATSK